MGLSSPLDTIGRTDPPRPGNSSTRPVVPFRGSGVPEPGRGSPRRRALPGTSWGASAGVRGHRGGGLFESLGGEPRPVLVDLGVEAGQVAAVVAAGQPELVDDDEFEGQQAGAADGDDGDDGAGEDGGGEGGDDEDAHLELDAADQVGADASGHQDVADPRVPGEALVEALLERDVRVVADDAG